MNNNGTSLLVTIAISLLFSIFSLPYQQKAEAKIIHNNITNTHIDTSNPLPHIDNDSAPSDIFVKFYDPGIPFDKVVQLVANDLFHNKTHTLSEMSLLTAIENELYNYATNTREFSSLGTNNQCDLSGMKTSPSLERSLERCDTDAAFIHEVCLQSTIGNDTSTCQPDMVSDSSTYLQKRGITDPQTDALAYTRFLDIIQKENPSPIIGVVEIDTTKEGAIKHFGTLNK